MPESIYLTGISYELEEPREIQQLEELRDQRELFLNFRSLGLASYSPSRRSPASLATESARRTLWKAGAEPGEVDFLLYATTTFDHRSHYSTDIQRLIADLELERAFPIGITLSECANTIAALTVASKLIEGGSARTVLLITADGVVDGGSRIVPPEVSIASDAAASVLVTGEEGGRFRLLATEEHAVAWKSDRRPQEDFTEYLKVSSKGIEEVCRRVLRRSGTTPDAIRWLITNNYNRSVASLYSNQSGVDMDRVYTDNISRFGHGFGADVLINLSDCLEDHPASPSDLFLLLSAGPTMWATAVIALG